MAWFLTRSRPRRSRHSNDEKATTTNKTDEDEDEDRQIIAFNLLVSSVDHIRAKKGEEEEKLFS